MTPVTPKTAAPKKALLLHGLTNGPETMWRYREWLEQDGWQVDARPLLGHAMRPAAPSYTVEAHAADAMHAGDHWNLVVGHSLGAVTAIAASTRAPGWAARLFLVDPPWFIPRGAMTGDKFRQFARVDATADELAAAYPHWHPYDIETKMLYVHAMAPELLERTFADQPEWNFVPQAKALTVPTFVLAGERAKGSVVDPALLAEIIAANPKVQGRAIPGTGHNVHRDNAEAVRKALMDWLVASPFVGNR